MPNKKTLYIVGAGASSEVSLPNGDELKKKIANLLNIQFKDGLNQSSGDYFICEALRIHVKCSGEKNINLYLSAARHIRNAMPQAISIDNFIDTHKGDKNIELCGKLAIVRSILDSERHSLLYFDNSNCHNILNFSNLEKTWYTNFMRLLTENCTKENLSERFKSIAIIVFNYDRCIEHFLYNSLQNYYSLTQDEAGKLVNGIEIYHPYGVVGSLPWQDEQSVAFGDELSSQQLLDLAHRIKTFTESIDPTYSNILAIRNNINNANSVIFLGFAYHKSNMKLLMSDSSATNSAKTHQCFGTAQGISDADCESIRSELEDFYKTSNVNIRNDLKCYQLFEEYWRSLFLN